MDGKLQRKLRKLIARATSADHAGDATAQREADQARRLAQELLDTHGLIWADFDRPAEEAENPDIFLIDECGHEIPWKIMLANGIAEFLGCAAAVTQGGANIHIIGRELDVSAVRYMYAAAVRQLQADADREWGYEFFPVQTEENWNRSFLVHAAKRVQQRMSEARKEAREISEEQSTALVKMDRQLARFMEQVPTKRDTEQVVVGDGSDAAGRAAGDRVRLESGTALRDRAGRQDRPAPRALPAGDVWTISLGWDGDR
jgi:hypothetical protein